MAASLRFNASDQDGRRTISVFGEYEKDGEQVEFDRIVTPANPSFERLATYLLATDEADRDVEYVHGLVDPAIGIGRMLQEEFGDRVTFDLHTFRVDGVPSDTAIAKHVKQKVLAGDDDWQRLVRFMVNLEANPSFRAQQFLWKWVEDNGMTITEDGRILGYKGVQNDGFSKHSGPNNFVNGVLYKDGQTTQVPHEVGSVISKRRQDVDDSERACSTGLHVGTKGYAESFAPRLMTVIFNPKNVVGGNEGWKIRVSEYEVHSLADPVQFASPSYDAHPEPEAQEDQPRLPGVVPVEGQAEREAEAAGTVPLADLAEPPEGTGRPFGRVVLRDWAAVNPGLKADLANLEFGHKALARKYSDITTEASVRRYRKALEG